MKKKVFLIVLSCVAVIIVGFGLFLSIGLGLGDTTIKTIDISKVDDGAYIGELSGSRFGNKLEVTVHGGKIVEVEILKDMVVVVPDLSSKVFDEVIEKQSLQVDSISEATVSTKAYLKSIENALD